MKPSSRNLAALLLTFITGACGLVYEVTWHRYLASLLGSHAEATSAVLAIFLGGLAAGYAAFGAIARRRLGAGASRADLLRLYAAAEAMIGVWALLFPILVGGGYALSGAAPGGDGAAFAFDVLLTALLIGPPAVLMGATIPLLTQALPESAGVATRVHAEVYACNTGGAFAGALLGGFALIPWLGLDGVVQATACVNLAVGAAFLALARGARGAPLPPPPDREPHGPRAGSLIVVVALAGFAMMALQTTANRLGALTLGASPFTFAIVVAAFVLAIAAGSFAVAALRRIPAWLVVASQGALVAILLFADGWLPDVTYWAHVLRAMLRDLPENFWPYQVATATGALVALAVPVALSGALLPLVFDFLRRERGGLGRVAGRLYAWNTVGSLLGALLAGHLLLLWLDLHHVYRLATGLLGVGTALLAVTVLGAPRLVAGGLALALLVALGFRDPWPPERTSAGLFRVRRPTEHTFAGPGRFFARTRAARVVFATDDPTTTVAVKVAAGAEGGERVARRAIVTNGKSDGDLHRDYPTMALAGLLPALFVDRLERAFVIGWGTGVTVGELASIEGVREVVVSEISRGVIAAAPLFEHGNLGALANPRTRIVRSDAYRVLLRSEGRFDVIASEPSNPWVTGVETLYTREFLEAARARLAPGGVYAQWFHLYETDLATVELVLRTYREVFPHVSVWYTLGPDLLLLGFTSEEGALDLARARARFAREDLRSGFERVGIPTFVGLLAHEVLPVGVIHAARLEGPLHTRRHPRLGHSAARAFFAGRRAVLPRFAAEPTARVGRRNSLLGRHLRSLDLQELRAAVAPLIRETCGRARPVECTAVLTWAPGATGAGGQGMQDARRALVADEPGLDLAAITALFPRAPAGKGAVDPAAAEETTRLFFGQYHHGLAFDPQRLRDAWRRCRAGPRDPTACSSGAARARDRLAGRGEP